MVKTFNSETSESPKQCIEPAKQAVLPPLAILAKTATIANLFFIAVALAVGKLLIAISIAGGLLVGLVMYAGIYSFTNNATNILVEVVGGKANSQPSKFMPTFVLVSIGKFIGIGLLLYVLVRLLHVNLFALVAGFLITQIAVTVVCIRSLKTTKLVG